MEERGGSSSRGEAYWSPMHNFVGSRPMGDIHPPHRMLRCHDCYSVLDHDDPDIITTLHRGHDGDHLSFCDEACLYDFQRRALNGHMSQHNRLYDTYHQAVRAEAIEATRIYDNDNNVPPPPDPLLVLHPTKEEVSQHDVPVIDDDSTTPTCVVCTVNKPVCIVWPCRHMCMCCECARKLCNDGAAKVGAVKCPVCSSVEVLAIQRVFL